MFFLICYLGWGILGWGFGPHLAVLETNSTLYSAVILDSAWGIIFKVSARDQRGFTACNLSTLLYPQPQEGVHFNRMRSEVSGRK